MSYENGTLICNSCKATYAVPVEELEENTDLAAAQYTEGWSRLDATHHLCPKCSAMLMNARTQIVNKVEARSKHTREFNMPM